jgi:predicted ATPase
MPKNPYYYSGALDPGKNRLVCISRGKEIKRVIEGIKKGSYWVILGSREIGKTTFLRQIEHRFRDAYFLYFNMEVAPTSKESFYPWITQEFSEKIPHESSAGKGNKLEKHKEDSSGPEFDFFNFLENFRPKNKHQKVILLIDEFEGIPSLESFLHLWRKVYHERFHKEELNKYAIVMTGGIELLYITSGPKSIFNFAEKLYLADFSPEESGQLIEGPFKRLNIDIDEKAKEKLIAHPGGHPRLLQESCYFLVERAREKGKRLLEKDVYDAFYDLFVSATSLDTLKMQVGDDKKLRFLIEDILKGEKIKYQPYKEFSIAGAGPVVEDPDSFCAIRNKIYENFLRKILTPPEEMLIKGPSKDDFLDLKKEKPMPRAIKQIRLKDYHGIIETGIQLPVDARWIFLTGENAYGKTAVLRGLAVGLFGERDEERMLTKQDSKYDIAVEIYNNGENLINNTGTLKFEPFTRFAAYGPSRLAIQSDRTDNDITGKSSKTYSLFNDDGVALNIERELLLWKLKGEPQYEIVKEILLRLLPHGADIEVDTNKNEVLYIEKESDEGGDDLFKPVRFKELAAGNKSIIAMIGDLIIRFYEEYKSLSPGILPGNFEGIVIIDELDLHLHPKWLWRLPGILSNVFPGIQFIASTHSEISLLGAPEESVFLKVTRNEKEGIQIQRVYMDFKNLLSHQLLTSPMFDLEKESMPKSNKKFSQVRTENSYQEILETNKITSDLKDFEKSDKDFPDDLLEAD